MTTHVLEGGHGPLATPSLPGGQWEKMVLYQNLPPGRYIYIYSRKRSALAGPKQEDASWGGCRCYTNEELTIERDLAGGVKVALDLGQVAVQPRDRRPAARTNQKGTPGHPSEAREGGNVDLLLCFAGGRKGRPKGFGVLLTRHPATRSGRSTRQHAAPQARVTAGS